MLTVKKAITGLYWDVIYNGVLIERYDTKWEAEQAAVSMRVKFAGLC